MKALVLFFLCWIILVHRLSLCKLFIFNMIKHTITESNCCQLYLRDTKSYVKDTKSHIRNTESYVKDTKSYIRNTESYVTMSYMYEQLSRTEYFKYDLVSRTYELESHTFNTKHIFFQLAAVINPTWPQSKIMADILPIRHEAA